MNIVIVIQIGFSKDWCINSCAFTFKLNMECDNLFDNLDWDPCYLAELFKEDFFDLSHLWIDTVTDMEMLEFSNKFEKYNPCVEDISLEDDILVDAVNRIESE